jgi:hypothetical protein
MKIKNNSEKLHTKNEKNKEKGDNQLPTKIIASS